MDFRFGFFAKASEVSPEGNFSVLGGGYTTLTFPELPGTFNTVVVTQFWVSKDDYGKTFHVALEIQDPAQQKLPIKLEGQALPKEDRQFPGVSLGFNFVFNLTNLVFLHPGEYQFSIIVNGEKKGMASLHIAMQTK